MAVAHYVIDGTGYLAQNQMVDQIGTLVGLSDLFVGDDSLSTFSLSRELTLPADAQIDRAVVTVTAQPGGVTRASEIAEIRAAAVEAFDPDDADHAIAIDFERLVTVSDVFAIPSPTAIRTWSGDRFFGTSAKEMRTERLLLEFVGTGDVGSIGPGITFRLPTIPSGLEVSVDGTTTWFEGQGSAAGSEPPEVVDGVSFVVDVTEAVRTALAAKAASGDGSTVPLSLALSAATPGHLTLDAEVTIHRVHQVAFPEGPARTVEAAEEGPIGVELPLPPESSGWTVDLVDFVGRASLPAQRVIPPVGPDFSVDARLGLIADRPLLIRLPEELLDPLATLTGVRLPLASGSGGAELTGRLLAADGAKPGQPLDGGELTPVTLEPDLPSRWTTLECAAEVEAVPAWLELAVGYGDLDWELTPAGAGETGAEVFLRHPGGSVRPLTTVAGIGPQRGALRLVGVADPNRPVHGLILGLVDDGADGLPFTPTRDGTRARINVVGGLQPVGGILPLAGVASVGGSFTFESVQVTYREAASEEGV